MDTLAPFPDRPVHHDPTAISVDYDSFYHLPSRSPLFVHIIIPDQQRSAVRNTHAKTKMSTKTQSRNCSHAQARTYLWRYPHTVLERRVVSAPILTLRLVAVYRWTGCWSTERQYMFIYCADFNTHKSLTARLFFCAQLFLGVDS